MRAAPPVDFPLARRGLWAGLAGLLAGLVAAVPIAWLAWHLHVARVTSAGAENLLMVLAIVAALAAARLGASRAGRHGGARLQWDGAGWALLGLGQNAIALRTPSVRMDLGRAMLLRAAVPGASARWLAVESRDGPVAWHGLRVALAQPLRTRAPALPAAERAP